MCEDMKCPLCGQSTVDTVDWIELPKNASGGGGGRYPTTVACRNGCDRSRMDEWREEAPALLDQCARSGRHA